MKNRILVISSEPLTPEYTLGSTFELSQAKILARHYDVALLSVTVHTPFFQACRTALKNALMWRWQVARTYGNLVFRLAYHLLKGHRYWSAHVQIEGVDVFIGNGFSLNAKTDSEDHFRIWTSAGKAAFDQYVASGRMPDLVHAHGRFMVAGLLALQLKRENGIPFIYTEHSSRFPSGYVPSEAIPFLNKIIDGCTRFIAVSEHLLQKVEETLDREIPKAKVVANVLDPVYQVPLSRQDTAGGCLFVNIANLEHRKGIDILLRAFKRAFNGHPFYQLRIIGEGPLLGDLRELARYLELDHVVEFMGPRSKSDIKKILDRAQVFVFPSRFETFGVSVIEALARGCPVIVTACGGPEEFVEDQAGIVIEAENEQQLVNALQDMSENLDRYDAGFIHDQTIERFGSSVFLRVMQEVYSDVAIVSAAIRRNHP